MNIAKIGQKINFYLVLFIFTIIMSLPSLKNV